MEAKPVILVVEDDSPIFDFICTSLSANGYRCKQAETGSNALAMIMLHNPDIIILDLGLPDMDGMEIITKVRKWLQTPIIVVSARDKEREKVEALDCGADDYLTKPFGIAELLARVRVALRHSERSIADDGEHPHHFSAGGAEYRLFKKAGHG